MCATMSELEKIPRKNLVGPSSFSVLVRFLRSVADWQSISNEPQCLLARVQCDLPSDTVSLSAPPELRLKLSCMR